MHALVAFVMRGPVQAASMAAAGLLLGYVLPPFAWVSAAVLALVLLRLGDAALLRAGLPAFVIVWAAGTLAWREPMVVAAGALATWLPPLAVARVLRGSGNLVYALAAACVLGWLIVAGVPLLVDDPTATWRELLLRLLPPEQIAAQTTVSEEALRGLIDRFAPLMTALVAVSVVLSAITSVLLARWWQAKLDRPGAFQAEFHGLRMGRTAAGLTAALAAAAAVTHAPLVIGLALVAACVFVFQGIAVMHGLVKLRGMAKGWLVGLYIIAVMLPAQVCTGLALVGIVDAWADFRGRALAGP